MEHLIGGKALAPEASDVVLGRHNVDVVVVGVVEVTVEEISRIERTWSVVSKGASRKATR